ncbi:MAG: magnesium/cobalt transporter CorA [Pyrinomonadaceae bacterium]|nr:magnesium/cobalt transporter CorA [Pyrinomonadaceae bacterium]MCX7639501.1 magnesium/cobalt transporter CorA [Pyrinomonadaceae bacterium]MDW8304448.1 magnesium/cobalt transporter CorA [Acidobacteriota bacterium]
MEIFAYNKKEKKLLSDCTLKNLPELLSSQDNLIWVDMESPTPEEEKILSEVFNFHPLAIEDAIETRNHPKIESFEDYLFFIVHGIKSETSPLNFVTKELDGFLGKNFLVTYHKEKSRSIDKVKHQVRNSSNPFKKGLDYLLHQILDQIVDSYIPVIEDFERTINNIEDRILKAEIPDEDILEEIMKVKRNIARLIRIGSKQEKLLYRLSHGDFPLIQKSNLPFYRDVYDHLLRVVVLAENYRDLVNNLFSLHFNAVTVKTNEAIKIMTVISTIMLPLSVIAGIYGMNFENMPELKTEYGYFVTLGFMFLVGVSLLTYFWRKGWILRSKK